MYAFTKTPIRITNSLTQVTMTTTQDEGHILMDPNIPLSRELDIVYGTTLLLVTLLGTPGNVFSFYYFLSKKRDVSSIIYTGITAVDTLICCCGLPPAISYFNHRQPTLFSDEIFCNLWILIFRVLSGMSIFCVALLSISRTFFLLKPFKRIPHRAIVGVMAFYLVFLLVETSIIFWERGGHYMYFNGYVDCSFVDKGIDKYEKVSDLLSKMIYTIPIFPILISCVISVAVLLKNSRNRNDSYEVGVDEKRYASITIVIFTFIFAIFNIPASLLNLIGYNSELQQKILSFDTMGYFGNFVFTLSIPLNAMCNAVLYTVRMKQLKMTLLQKFSGRYQKYKYNLPQSSVQIGQLGRKKMIRIQSDEKL